MARKKPTLQTFIVDRLADKGLTRYGMALACRMRPSSIYGRLTHDALWPTMARMLAYLNAEICVDDSVLRLSLDRRGQVVMEQGDEIGSIDET